MVYGFFLQELHCLLQRVLLLLWCVPIQVYTYILDCLLSMSLS